MIEGTGLRQMLLLIPALAGASLLLVGGALASAIEPSVVDAMADRPLAVVQIAAGIGLSLALLAVPATRVVGRLLGRPSVTLAGGAVSVIERTLLGRRERTIPLSAFVGVAHHIRASLSGLTHEIVLVHPEPRLSVTLVSAEKVTQAMLDEASRDLGLPEVPARSLYERRVTQSPRTAENPTLAAASA
jgi:hypothetical protein